jgi:hypothetical protein
LWHRTIQHGTAGSKYQHLLSLRVWCDVVGDQLIGRYNFPQSLTYDIYANLTQHELPFHYGNFLYEYEVRFIAIMAVESCRLYPKQHFLTRWLGRGGEQNCPQWSTDPIALVNICGVT